MTKSIKSHVYIPKSILNRFSYKDGNTSMINVLNSKTNIIGNCSTTLFNRTLGYYTNSNEQILKSKAEDKIGNVISKIDNCINLNKDINLTDKDKLYIRSYLTYLWIRNDYLSKLIINRYNLNIDIKTIKNLLLEDEPKYELIGKYTKDFDIKIFINMTNKPFVLTSSSYVINSNDKDNFIISIVLSPRIIIKYFKKNKANELLELDQDNEDIIYVYGINHVDYENKLTYNNSKYNEPYSVIGDIKVLEELKINND